MHTLPTPLTSCPPEPAEVRLATDTGLSFVATYPISLAWANAVAALAGEPYAVTQLETTAPKRLFGASNQCAAWLAVGVCSDLADGLRILEHLRVSGKHKFVLLISAQEGTETGAALLHAGADFWLPWDAEPQLIASVVTAAKRRGATRAEVSGWRSPAAGEQPESRQDSLGVALEPTQLTIRIGSHSARLRGAEFRICQYLLHHRERWVLDAELRKAVLNTGTHSSESLVRVHVHQIRRALGHYHRCLISQRRLGYRFVLQAANAE